MDSSILNSNIDLQTFAKQKAQEYQSGQPYPHITADNFFDAAFLDGIQREFPSSHSIAWDNMHDPNQVKLATRNEQEIPLLIRNFIYQLNSATFLRFLEQLSGIDNLISDPHLCGGGLHMIRSGGKLNIHADFNKHPTWNLDRRLNLLVYLNKNWKEEYGGHFELWDRDMRACEKKLAPVFNRMVIFSTTEFSYHGHPHPLTCPQGTARRSIALYYYSNGRPEDERAKKHNTIFRSLPSENKAKRFVKMFIPPIAYVASNKLLRR